MNRRNNSIPQKHRQPRSIHRQSKQKNVNTIQNIRHRPNRPDLRPPQVNFKPNPVQMAESILFTGGLGDIFALESYFSEEYRRAVKTIYYATRQRKLIEEALKSLPNWRGVQNHKILWDDFSDLFCFFSKKDCLEKMIEKKIEMPSDYSSVEDWSILTIFPHISNKLIKFQSSSFIRYNLANISRFNLPDKYFAICPYTTNNYSNNRNLDATEWINLCSFLAKKGILGVVLNNCSDSVPVDPNLIDLSNKTNLIESIEILKNSCGYIGIDSALSVIASKIFGYPDLIIKSNNMHCINHSKIYFAPRDNDTHLVKRINL